MSEQNISPCDALPVLLRALCLAAIPLESIRASGTDKFHSPEAQRAINEAITAIREALAHQQVRVIIGDTGTSAERPDVLSAAGRATPRCSLYHAR